MSKTNKRQGSYARKWSTEKCKEYIDENNIDVELLSEYVDIFDKMKFRCCCGEIFEATWHDFMDKRNPKRQCNSCGRKSATSKTRKVTCETIREYLKNNNYPCKLVSNEYVNCDEKLEFECQCGEHFFASWSNIKKMTGLCKKCTSKLKSNNSYKKEAKKRSYIDNDAAGYLQSRIDEVYGENEFRLLSVDGSYLKVLHVNCNRSFTIRKDHFILGKQGCKHCNKEARDFGALTNEEFLRRVEAYQDDYEFLSEYVNQNEPIKIRHKKCGHILYKSPAKIYDRGIYCPHCDGTKGEQYISSYLDKNDIEYIPQYSFNDCQNKRKLSFDFYLPEHNVVIEYQGQQHYHPVGVFGGQEAFDKQLVNDEIKRNYCLSKGVHLIEISYNDYHNIDSILNDSLLCTKEVVC